MVSRTYVTDMTKFLVRIHFLKQIYREKKLKFNLIPKLTNRWRTMSKTVLFTFLTLLMALEAGFIWAGKMQNQLTYKHAPSSGEIFNNNLDLPMRGQSCP